MTQYPGGFGGPDPIGGGPLKPGAPHYAAPGGAPQWPAPGGAAQWPAPGYPGTFPAPQPRRPKLSPRAIGAAVVAAVLVAGLAIFIGRSGHFGATPGKAGSPGAAVKGYLEALARGDADGALAFASDKPASTALLSDDILKQQIAQWPISDIRILSEDAYTDTIGTVHVSAKFGEQVSDSQVSVVNNGGGWQLQKATMRMSISKTTSQKALSTLRLFGKPLEANAEVYNIFPGWVDIATTNDLLTMKLPDQPLLLNELGPADTYLSLGFEINDKGQKVALDAAKAAIENCVKSTDLAPPNCPQGTTDPSLVPGTAKWTLPDLSGLTLAMRFFLEDELTVPLEGLPDFPVTADARSGGTKSGTVYPGRGTADFSTNPPTISFR